MGLFWDYFRNGLRFALIGRPGPLALLAEGGAAALDAVRGHILWLRDQFLPEKCDEVHLTLFAASRGIVRAALETEAHYQARVRFAYLWWARGGRPSAMSTALVQFFDFEAAKVISLRAEDPARWAEFRVEIDVCAGNLEVSPAQIEWAINEMKPARSRLAEVRYGFAVAGAVPVIAVGLQSSEIITVYPLPDEPGETALPWFNPIGGGGATL